MTKKQYLKDKDNNFAIIKGVNYYKTELGSIICEPVTQNDLVGGTKEAERNSEHNQTRLQRIKELHKTPIVLDYGCGNGLLVEFLKANKVDATGYDKYSEKFNSKPTKEAFTVVTMVEVVEHLERPYKEFKEVFTALQKGGKLMIESTFADNCTKETEYINPEIGHISIFSYKEIENILTEIGFKVLPKINGNVLVFAK
jgi:cyclopropane fatty-acyl-phospholipid synthase-like methyltransferase